MDYKEAVEWLKGKRSMCNTVLDNTECAEVDASMMKQAYWMVKAYKEGLIKLEDNNG